MYTHLSHHYTWNYLIAIVCLIIAVIFEMGAATHKFDESRINCTAAGLFWFMLAWAWVTF